MTDLGKAIILTVPSALLAFAIKWDVPILYGLSLGATLVVIDIIVNFKAKK